MGYIDHKSDGTIVVDGCHTSVQLDQLRDVALNAVRASEPAFGVIKYWRDNKHWKDWAKTYGAAPVSHKPLPHV